MSRLLKVCVCELWKPMGVDLTPPRRRAMRTLLLEGDSLRER